MTLAPLEAGAGGPLQKRKWGDAPTRRPGAATNVEEVYMPYPANPSSDEPSAAVTIAKLVLEDLDVPVLVVTTELRIAMANRAALQQLGKDSPLRLVDGHIQVHSHPSGSGDLRAAVVAAAGHGHQKLIVLKAATGNELPVAVVPLAGVASTVVLLLGRSALCPELSLVGYAKAVGLTPSETNVLHELCRGATPEQIAIARGVKLSTVRTQIDRLRTKTDSADIREVMRKIGRLPSLPLRIYSSLPA
jgi:DNA-binding CsgD family transcriptional regulator